MTTGGFRIELAELGDVDALRRIETAAAQRFRAIGMQDIATTEPLPESVMIAGAAEKRMWLARDSENNPVGFLLADVIVGMGYLKEMSALREVSGNKLGARMIDVMFEWAAQKGLPWVILRTFSQVPWNGPYYQRLGFDRVPVEHLNPAFRPILAQERDAGMDPSQRVFMRKAVVIP